MLSKLSIEGRNEFLDDLFDRIKGNEAKLYNSQSEFYFLSPLSISKKWLLKGNLYNDNDKSILGVRNGGLKSKDISGIFKKSWFEK